MDKKLMKLYGDYL